MSMFRWGSTLAELDSRAVGRETRRECQGAAVRRSKTVDPKGARGRIYTPEKTYCASNPMEWLEFGTDDSFSNSRAGSSPVPPTVADSPYPLPTAPLDRVPSLTSDVDADRDSPSFRLYGQHGDSDDGQRMSLLALNSNQTEITDSPIPTEVPVMAIHTPPTTPAADSSAPAHSSLSHVSKIAPSRMSFMDSLVSPEDGTSAPQVLYDVPSECVEQEEADRMIEMGEDVLMSEWLVRRDEDVETECVPPRGRHTSRQVTFEDPKKAAPGGLAPFRMISKGLISSFNYLTSLGPATPPLRRELSTPRESVRSRSLPPMRIEDPLEYMEADDEGGLE